MFLWLLAILQRRKSRHGGVTTEVGAGCLSLGKTGGALGAGLACKSRKRDTPGTGEILETQSCVRCWLPQLAPQLGASTAVCQSPRCLRPRRVLSPFPLCQVFVTSSVLAATEGRVILFISAHAKLCLAAVGRVCSLGPGSSSSAS